ncbi:MAG: hypothetical protein K0S37_1295 [Microbacterium sp.]|jgi:hypothetical protein|nr:hypothetical protein [Microbacterium sp.]
METGRSIPLGAALSAVAALVFATPTLFLPADVHVSVKLVFIVAGSILFAVGVLRVRGEGAAPTASEPSESDPPTRG